MSALNTISKGTDGKQLLNDFNEYATDVSIQSTSTVNITQEGTDVYWNPTNLDGGTNTNGSTERPAFIGLAHELAHSRDKLSDGIANTNEWIKLSDGQKISHAEKYASWWENKIREENNIPLREFYSPGIEQSRLISKSSYIPLFPVIEAVKAMTLGNTRLPLIPAKY